MTFVPTRKMMPAQMNHPTRARTIPVVKPESPPPKGADPRGDGRKNDDADCLTHGVRIVLYLLVNRPLELRGSDHPFRETGHALLLSAVDERADFMHPHRSMQVFVVGRESLSSGT
jgi:hypothetical protein